jgi:hypothetical protein
VDLLVLLLSAYYNYNTSGITTLACNYIDLK